MGQRAPRFSSTLISKPSAYEGLSVQTRATLSKNFPVSYSSPRSNLGWIGIAITHWMERSNIRFAEQALDIASIQRYAFSRLWWRSCGSKRMQYCISATYAAHSRQLWLARNEVLHSKTYNQQMNIVRSVVETVVIQPLYQQPIYWEQEIGTTRTFSQIVTQSPDRHHSDKNWICWVWKSIDVQSKEGGHLSLITSLDIWHDQILLQSRSGSLADQE